MSTTRLVARLPLLVALALLACSDDTTSSGTDSGDTDLTIDAAVDSGPPPCGSGARPLPPGLTTLKHDDGVASSNVREQTWQITLQGAGTFEAAKLPIHEAVRFAIDRPATIHGFSVRWTQLPQGGDPKTELAAGLHRDFGHNGFDFWPKDPLWAGTRCVGDVDQDGWLTYVFDKPVKLDHPQLVFVAHRADDPADPVFAFDASDAASGCDAFADCPSSVNLPTAAAPPQGIYFNGVTFKIPRDFLVRLHLAYEGDALPASQRHFERASASGLPEVRSGVAFGDIDNDGNDDVLLGKRLFRGDGKGRFAEITASSGIEALDVAAAGGVFGDYDNDGCLDLFLFSNSQTKGDTLLKGDCKGAFADVTVAAGLKEQPTTIDCKNQSDVLAPATAAAWIDLDADGYLDLYLANYICSTASGGEAFFQDTVFHNKGDGSFEEWTTSKGFASGRLPSRGAAPADGDGDGDVDLFVNNYRLERNQFYRNNGDGTVSEAAEALGLRGNASFLSGGYRYGHSIGAAWGDLDGDGDLDLVVANLAHPRFWSFSDRTQVLLFDGQRFNDAAGAWDKPFDNPSGLRYQETHSVPLLADFDLDGKLDLLITAVYEGRPTDVYRGKGDGSFVLDAYQAGIDTTNGWAVAASDVDNDGDVDVYASGLFRNARYAPTSAQWIQVRAIGGVTANWAALGATVRVSAGGEAYTRHVQGGSGKGCQDSQYLVFGLGSATQVDAIEVTYPGGKRVQVSGPFATKQRVWVYEDGTHHLGWAPKK